MKGFEVGPKRMSRICETSVREGVNSEQVTELVVNRWFGDREQRQQRQLRDRPRCLDHRIKERAHDGAHAHDEADRHTDQDAKAEGEAEAHQADGGVVQQAMTSIDIQCLPADLPAYIEVDLKELELNDTLHVTELALPKGVEPVAKLKLEDSAVVSIHVPKEIVIEEEAAAPVTEIIGEAPAEGEEAAAEGAEGEKKEGAPAAGEKKEPAAAEKKEPAKKGKE